MTQGGVERHVEELSIRLARNGHEVLVYTRPYCVPKEYKKYEEVNLISLPSWHTKNLDAITHTFLSILHALKNKVDVIHLQGVGPSLLAWLPKLLSRRVKVISTVHSADWEHQKWSKLAQWLLKLGCKFACLFADETIAVSRSLQRYCLVNYKGAAIYIPNGVNLPEKSKNNQGLLENLNLWPQKYLLVVSRLVKHKGIHHLIEAFKYLKDKYQQDERFKDLKLVIAGSTAFTEDYQKYLFRLINGRTDILFTGAQTGANLETLFRNAYLFVQPSESEGLSIAVLEAMAYAKPVLVSNIEENLELVAGNAETGAIGFDFKNKNVPDLAAKLELLILHPIVARQVGRKAREFVKLYYNWEEIVQRTEKVYKNCVRLSDKMRKSLWANFVPSWNRG